MGINQILKFRLPISAALSSTPKQRLCYETNHEVSITYLGSTVQHLVVPVPSLSLIVSITYLGSTVQHRT